MPAAVQPSRHRRPWLSFDVSQQNCPVMNTIDAIARDPNLNVIVSDDKEAKAVLLALGLLNHFTPPRSSGAEVQMIAYDGVKTHLVAAFFYHGFEKKKDNGFSVNLMPRGAFPAHANHQLIENMKKNFETGGVRATVHQAHVQPNN
jgi:hypothetical protein